MRYTPFSAIIILLLSGALFSCKKDGKVPDMGYNYFPDRVGSYVVYDVDSFYFDDNLDKTDTFKFLLKEKIESIFTDNQGRPAIRLERYVKYYDPAIPYSAMDWALRDVWTETKTATTAQKVEENERYIKLAFPVKESQIWDGNAENTKGEEKYEYYFIDQARYIGGVHFDSVLQVNQKDELNLIIKQEYSEKYARNVGLVYKKVIDVKSQPDGVADSMLSQFYSTPIMERVDSGVFYTYTFNSLGIEP
jgi:hypothetical protein